LPSSRSTSEVGYTGRHLPLYGSPPRQPGHADRAVRCDGDHPRAGQVRRTQTPSAPAREFPLFSPSRLRGSPLCMRATVIACATSRSRWIHARIAYRAPYTCTAPVIDMRVAYGHAYGHARVLQSSTDITMKDMGQLSRMHHGRMLGTYPSVVRWVLPLRYLGDCACSMAIVWRHGSYVRSLMPSRGCE
jgi:hypothetical protein